VTPGTFVYEVTSVSDANSCLVDLDEVAAPSATITVSPVPAATASVTDPVLCNGGTATVTIVATTGTEPYQFTLGTESNPTGVFYDVAPGTWNWILEDGSSCDPVTGDITVSEPDALVYGEPVVSLVTCSGEDDGQIVISATGGTGTITYSINPNVGAQSPSGTFSGLSAQTYTITATDENGCTETTDVTVGTVDDVTPPVIADCPADITFYTEDGDPAICSQTISWTEPTATDNCALASFTSDYNPGDAFPVGTNTVTYTATDAAGNTATCAFEVTVVDNTPPTFTAPNALTVNANANCDPPNLDPNVTLSKPYNLSDNCTASGSLTSSYSDGARVSTGVCEGNYTITRTWTVTDAAGNSSSQEQIITVEDNTRPSLTLPPTISIECSDSDHPDNTGWATSTDNCTADGDILLEWTDVVALGVCDGRYTITRTWTATDDCGNFRTGTQTINVTDNTPPEVQPIPTTYITDRNAIPDPDLSVVVATDNCALEPIVFLDEIVYGLENKPGYCPDSVEYIYRVSDGCANYVDVSQMIVINDPTQCEKCLVDVPFFVVDFRDNINAVYTFENVLRTSHCCEHDGQTMHCASFNIILGDDAVGVQILVDGTVPPGQEWDQDCTVLPNNGTGIYCLEPGKFHLFTYCKNGVGTPQRTNTYTFSAVPGIVMSDDITTRVECSTVIEATADGIDNIRWRSIWPGTSGQYNDYLSCLDCLDPVFTADENSPAEIKYEICGDFPGDQYCYSGGSNCDTITVYVYEAIEIDLNINPDMVCDDDILPVITPDISPASNTYELDWYSGYDASGTLLCEDCPSYQPPTGGDGPYSVHVTDVREGIPCSEATFNFDIVFDLTGPTIQAPPEPLVITCNDPAAAQQIQDWLALATAEYTDASGNIVEAEVTHDFTGIDMACGEVITVTFSAVDQCVNENTAQSTITVEDNTAPIWVTAPGDLDRTVECSDADALAAAQALEPVPTDECDDDATLIVVKIPGDFVPGTCPNEGTITNTWTVTDACGNTSEVYTQVITITDNQPPVLANGADGTGECEGPDPGQNSAYIAWRDGFAGITATDACGASVITYSEGTWSEVDVCTDQITVTFTATDDCGNDVSVSYTFTITDTTVPFVIDGENGTAECQGADPNQNTEYIAWRDQFANASTDDVCGNSALSVTESPWVNIDACTVQTTITVTATDDCGLTETADFTFTITDTTVPFVIDGENGTAECQGTDPSQNTEYILWRDQFANTSTNDACGNSTLSYTEGPWVVIDACTVQTTVTVTATDDCGLTETADFTFTITDSQAPVLAGGDNGTENVKVLTKVRIQHTLHGATDLQE
jgi:hypothetical protein